MKKTSISIVSGMTNSRVIGKGNSLPWKRIKDDLPNFKRLTDNQTVVMGLNTYHSIGGALPNRNNIVLSMEEVDLPDVDVCLSIPEAMEKARSYNKEIFIIGGASIYEQFIPLANYMYLSYIKKDYDGDKYFPNFNKKDWDKISEKDFDEFTFITLKRKDVDK